MLKWLLLLASAAMAQPAFEVASIKEAPPVEPGRPMRFGCPGGPGTKDPGLWSCENMTLYSLVLNAYDVAPYQVSAPSWMNESRYNISAKVPATITTKDQLRQAIQTLLADRFGLKVHRETRPADVYELVVAKGGPKMKEAVPKPPDATASTPAAPGSGPKLGADGFPELAPGRNGMAIMNGKARWQSPDSTLEVLVRTIANQVRKPVIDATGLKGNYDLSLYWVANFGAPPPPPPGAESAAPFTADPGGPSFLEAVSQQLGLKLEPKKGAIEMLVVDHAEKKPTEN